MTNENGDRDPIDWERYEEEIGGPGAADVVDLDKARQRRDHGDQVDADAGPDGSAGPVLVDSVAAQRRPRFTLSGLRDAKRRPIVPGWLRSRAEATGNALWALELAGHTLAYHGIRMPKYAAKVTWRAPRGAVRLVVTYVRWWFDREGEVFRQASAREEDADLYLKLARQRDRRVRWRGIVTVPVALAVFLALVWLATAASTPTVWAALAALIVACGVVGTPADKPLLDTAVVRTDAAPLTSAEVVRALSTLRIVGIDRAIRAGDTGKRWFPAPIQRDNGAGWRAEVELPRGVTATEVVEKREELASALARPLGCVWPEANTDVHPGRLVLFVADRDMSRAKPVPWPLLKTGLVDLFKSFPFGTDPRGRMVPLTLMFASMIIGSIPRMGKTFTLRLALLGAALDPRAWLYAFDLKGTGDLAPLEPVCHRYRAGDDDEDIEYAIIAMREVRAELRRRTKVIRELPRDLCPENKVTPELADRKTLGLHPVVIGVDECQVWFEHPKYGDEFEEICTDLVKRGPAAGIVLILATQRPDAKSLPTGISANAVLRFCLKVMGHTENDMVLGTSMHKTGIRATMFSRRDKGIGYLAGEGDDPQIARTAYIDGPTADAIVTRARAARERAGNLTGHAAGHTVDTVAVRRDTLLDDLAVVLGTGEAKVWTETVLERLAGLRPDAYAGMTRDQLTAALKVHGIKTKQVWGTDPTTGEGANRRGIDRADITAAITKRDREQGGRAAS
ncbi:cell division protein FtsK [Virgisporangium ochraceum]|uniref:Cell division protein FtsK n=1 Tax=Virgisporangium ochraceum TaxID=65505 RepID=A0A8J3ZK97_9ACTN|nr:cell division protein FtsK [Virgisporangium ochraceum]GIJ65642.1 cell division protein FtsK [Virgisporangium ochraceum]